MRPVNLKLSVYAALTVSMLLPSTESQANEDTWCQVGVLDTATANGGTNPITGAVWARKDGYRIAFVTEAVTNTTSADIADYNAFVQSVAASSSTYPMLGDASWNVIASSASVAARDNTGTNPSGGGEDVAIFLIDGVSKVADNNADLWDGQPDVRINRTENNTARANDTPVWTAWCATWSGSNGSGTQNNAIGAGGNVQHGLLNDQLGMWMSRSSAPTSTLLPMYALSEILRIQGPAPGTVIILK